MITKTSNDVIYGVLQIVATNRPGLVAETSAYVHKHGGNIVTGQGFKLGKQLFAATMVVSAQPENYVKLEAGLSALEALKLQPRLIRIPEIVAETVDSALRYELTLYAYDAEGIVSKVTEILTADGLDIVQLSAVTYPAPFEGQALFMVEMIVEAPQHLAAKRAWANLEALAPFHSWDLYWKPILKTGLKINPVAAYPPSKLGFKIEIPEEDKASRQ
jgi:glycine cleavage system regulatory protein